MNETWPVVTSTDDGIRQAGPPDACFYCQSKIGDEHRRDCVTVKRRVKLRYVFEIEVDVPHHWTVDDILFHRNESSWCADNAVNDIEKFAESAISGCLCGAFQCEYIGSVDDTPSRIEKAIE